MKQFYTKNYWLMFLFGILFLATSNTTMAQQLSDDQTSTYINTANGGQQVKVKIFGGATTCANGILNLTLPAGYTYKPSSAIVTPYDAAHVAGTPVAIVTESIAGAVTNLTIPSIPIGNYVEVSYDVTAGCGAETGDISYTLNACGSPASTGVGAVNIQKAKLNITVSPVTYVAPSTGVTYTRNILIKNDGIGKVDTVYLDRTVAAGFTYGAHTVTPGAGVTIINEALTGNRYRIITSGLSLGQSLTVAETVTVNATTSLSANYDAWYGPNAVKCTGQNGTGIGSAIISATPPNPSAPGLVLAVTTWPNLKCVGASDYVVVKITNSNTTEAATLTSLGGYLNQVGYSSTNVGQRSFYLENEGDIAVGNAAGPTGVWQSLNAVTRAGVSYAYTSGHNGGQAVQSTMTDPAGDIIIPAGGIYYVRFKVAYNPISEICPANGATYWYWPRLFADYTIAGAARVDYSNDNANNNWQITSPFDSSAPDAVGGTPYVINMNFNVRLLSQPQFNDNTGSVKLVFTLPTALTPSLAPADNTISDGTNTLTPTSVTFIGGKLILIFDSPLDVNRFNSNVSKQWKTNLKTQFACTGTAINYSYSMDAYVKMADCGPDIKLLCGANGNFEAHGCASGCIDAASSSGALLERTTIGTISNPANPINLTSFVTGDRANFTVNGGVITTTPGKEFNYLFVNVNPLGLTTAQYEFEAGVTATATITRGGTAYTISNIPLNGTTLATDKHTLRLHAGTMPAGLGGKFLNGDVVKVIVPLRFLLNETQSFTIKGTLYAADVAEPTAAEKLYCDHGYSARGNAVKLSQRVQNITNPGFGNCAQVTNGVEGRYFIDYMVNESVDLKVFNNEIREFFTLPNTFTIKTPDFQKITQIRAVLLYQQAGTAPTVVLTPIGAPVSDGAGFHTYTFNTSSLLSSLADTKINQSTRFDIFPTYKIICASSNFNGPANYTYINYPFTSTVALPNPAAANIAQDVFSTNGLFIPVNMTTGAAIQTIGGNTATWDVQITNIYNVVKGNVWLAPSATTGFTSVKVFEITTIGAATTGTEVMPNAAGLYELGSISAYGNKFYRIVGVLADCNSIQKLDIVYDFDCVAYPVSLQAGKDGCRAKTLSLEARPALASLQVAIQNQPTNPHVICDDLTYTFRINNSSLALVKDLGLKINLNGVNYVANSLQVAKVSGPSTPAAGDYAVPTIGSVTSIGAGNYNVTVGDSELTSSDDFIWIKVSFKPDGCNFVSGQRLTVSAQGKDFCGNVKQGDNEVLSNRINIDGMPTLLPTVAMTSTASPIIVNADGSFTVSAYKLKIQNTGSVAIIAGLGYGFSVKLPVNWALDPTAIVYNTGTATHTGVNPTTGEQEFSFSGGLAIGQSVELTVPITLAKVYTGTLACGAALQIQESVFAKFTPTGACAVACQITHIISDNSALSLVVPTPVVPTGSATQQFCDNAIAANKPTLANIALTGSKFMRWYNSPTKLYADSIPSTTTLVNGAIYYVRNAHVDNGTCQSAPFAVTVVVKSLITLTSIVEKCDAAGLNYKLTVTVNGTAPFMATGTGAAGTWTGNVWTSAAILAGTPYDINITDANNCAPLNVKDDAPLCCIFTVDCAAFTTPIAVSLFKDIPTKAIYTLAEYTAIGGAITATGCGAVEIIATNSANPGCMGTVTRTYTINTYNDVNTNGLRDITEPIIATKSCQQIYNVDDKIVPTGTSPAGTTGINACYVNATTAPTGVPAFNATVAAAGYTDNSGGVVTAVLTNIAVTGDNCEWTATYTFNVSDACGNVLANQKIVHSGGDKTAPEFVGTLPASMKAECGAIPEAAILTATDNCGTARVTFTETKGAACGSAIVRTWTAADACGNQTVHTQTITVEDKTAPVFTGTLPSNITVNCDQIPAAATLTATDNCARPDVTFSEVKTAGNCANEYILTRTWTAKDICGNAVTHTQIIKVEDKTPPVFVGTLPSDIKVSCDAIPTAPVLTATDACGTATVTYVEVRTVGTCEEGGFIITRTWTATDACGNTTTHKQVITVENTLPAIKVEKVADVQLVREVGDVIKYTIVVTNTGNLTLRNIKVVDPLTGMSEMIAVLAPGEKKTFTTNYVVKLSDFNATKIINIVTATGTDPKGNPITDDDKEEVAIDPVKFNIPNVITPNGDGKNDMFVIDGLEAYPENNLIIFNRWNNEVYNSHGYYKNNWTGQGLNDGTYYYLLKIRNRSGVSQNLTGHITLLRKN